jgi:hypothetical protein
MSKLLWMLLVIGSARADDDGRIHPKCVEESNTRRCWVERKEAIVSRRTNLVPALNKTAA